MAGWGAGRAGGSTGQGYRGATSACMAPAPASPRRTCNALRCALLSPTELHRPTRPPTHAQLLEMVEQIAADIDPAAPWKHPNATALDTTTLVNWINANAKTAFGAYWVAQVRARGWRLANHRMLHVQLHVQAPGQAPGRPGRPGQAPGLHHGCSTAAPWRGCWGAAFPSPALQLTPKACRRGTRLCPCRWPARAWSPTPPASCTTPGTSASRPRPKTRRHAHARLFRVAGWCQGEARGQAWQGGPPFQPG